MSPDPKPGVAKVGAAIGEILGLGNTILLPLRFLNESAAKFERAAYDKICKRIDKIPLESIVPVTPEIGVPILEKMSHTENEDLRNLFVELLGKAADSRFVREAHPSFVNVILNICPDEAKLIRHIDRKYTPFVTLEQAVAKTHGRRLHTDFVFKISDDLQFKDSDTISMYISNLSGLGIIEIHRDRFLTEDGAYNDIVEDVLKDFPEIIENPVTAGTRFDEDTLVYNKGMLVLTSFGYGFQRCCIEDIIED